MPQGNADAEQDDRYGYCPVSFQGTGGEITDGEQGQGDGQYHGPLVAKSVGEEAGGHGGNAGGDVSGGDEGACGDVGEHESELDLREDDHEGGGVEVLQPMTGDGS